MVLMVSVDVKQRLMKTQTSELSVKVEVDVLGTPSLIVLMVFADVKQHLKKKKTQFLWSLWSLWT